MTDRSPAAVVDRRVKVLRALADGPLTKAELVDGLDVSGSTVDRAIRDLSPLDFVARLEDGRHRLTRAGLLALRARDAGHDRVAAVADVADLLAGATLSFSLDPAVFDGATVVRAPAHAPYRPVERVVDLVADATHVSAYTPRVLSRDRRVFHDPIRAGATGTFVGTDDVFSALRTDRGADTREAIALERAAFYLVEREGDATLALVETPTGPEMGLVVHDASGPRGFVGNDDPAAVRWARGVLGEARAAATRIDPAERR